MALCHPANSMIGMTEVTPNIDRPQRGRITHWLPNFLTPAPKGSSVMGMTNLKAVYLL